MDGPAPPHVSLSGLRKEFHHFISTGVLGGKNLLQQIVEPEDDEDKPHAQARRVNVYHPFHSKEDWDLAKWLTDTGLPQASIDKFLKLERVSAFPLATQSAYINNLTDTTGSPVLLLRSGSTTAHRTLAPNSCLAAHNLDNPGLRHKGAYGSLLARGP